MGLISFTPIQDGVTSVSAAATNNPLNTIYNEFNGNITDANVASSAAIAGSKISYASISNPYKFSVYLAGTQTQQSSMISISWDTKIFDTGTNFSTTTHLFTAPIAGFYQFNAAFSITQDSGIGYNIQLLKNGASVVASGTSLISGATNAFAVACTVSSLIQLAANDTIAVQGQGNNNLRNYNTGVNATYFNGFLVSAT